MMIMAGGIDLITIFIGLETMAVSFYILAGFIKPSQPIERSGGQVFPARRLRSASSSTACRSWTACRARPTCG
jgi:hypothetical protein